MYCCSQQQHQGMRTVFKYDTTLRSHLVRPKDALEPTPHRMWTCEGTPSNHRNNNEDRTNQRATTE